MKIIDCTIRDGGLMNRWDFSLDMVRRQYVANTKAGIEYMEIGYKASTEVFDPKEYGPWRFCNEEDLEYVVKGIESNVKLSMMVDIGRCSKEDIIPAAESHIHTIRVACYNYQVDDAIDIANYCSEMGYETFINVMAITNNSREELVECISSISKNSKCDGIYLVDSFGNLSMSQTRELIFLYKSLAPNKKIGFHGHNNRQLALANSVMARDAGAEYLDASYYGMGRGAGNTPMELLAAEYEGYGYRIEPILESIHADIEPLMQELKWGYHIPYAITGITNQHPRTAMAYISEQKNDPFHHFFAEHKKDVC